MHQLVVELHRVLYWGSFSTRFSQVIRFDVHHYADDTQLYLFETRVNQAKRSLLVPGNTEREATALPKTEGP